LSWLSRPTGVPPRSPMNRWDAHGSSKMLRGRRRRRDRDRDAAEQSYRNAGIGQKALGIADGPFAVVENARRKDRARVPLDQTRAQVLRRADSATGNDRNGNRV